MTARTLLSRLRSTLKPGESEATLDEEIRQHLECLAEEFRAQGHSDGEAWRRARREFGNITGVREAARAQSGFLWMASLYRDAAFALRQLGRAPSFTAAAVLTLAIGIGGTTAVFSVLDVVALRPLSYPTPERLVVIHESLPRVGSFPASVADTEFWARHATSFDDLALISPAFMNLTGNGEPERLRVAAVSSTLFPLLGATPQLGRLPVAGEDTPGRDRVVVLGDGLWRRRFGADPGIVGRTIALDGAPYEVIGVLAAGFHAPNLTHLFAIPVPDMVMDAWKPIAIRPEERQAIGGYSYPVVGRLKEGVPLARAREELAGVQQELLKEVPGKGDLRTVIVPLQEQLGSRSSDTLWLLFAATGAVLLIGCVNIANLLLARMIARRRELAVRQAVGASTGRLLTQILVEHLVLCGLGGAAGLAVAAIALRLIVSLSPADVPRIDEVAIDARVLWFTVAVTVACGLIIGLVSAWRVRMGSLHGALAGRTATSVARPGSRLLVASEVGLCAACVAIALLLTESFAGLLSVDKGFDSSRVLTAGVTLPTARYTSEQQAAFFDAVTADIQRLPGVEVVAIATQLPLTGIGAISAFSAEGTTTAPMERPRADVRSVTPDYFRTVGLRLGRGRPIEASDREREVAVLSTQLAEQAWPGQDPIGRRFRFGSNPNGPAFEVIGTVSDVRGTALDQPPTPTAYVPFPQRSRGIASLLVRTGGGSGGLESALQRSIRTHDPDLPVPAVQTLDAVIAGSLDARRFQLRLVTVFALVALLLASIGVYGVMAYSVAQRRGELGVRLALGAAPRTVLMLVVRQAMTSSAIGLTLAVPLVWIAGRFLATVLVGVRPFDLSALLATATVVLLTALAAAAIPGIRATQIDAAGVLREG